MDTDLIFDVVEVGFKEFDRRKTPRGNSSFYETQNKAFIANTFNKEEEAAVTIDSGVRVNEF